jgi:hypothetical protein
MGIDDDVRRLRQQAEQEARTNLDSRHGLDRPDAGNAQVSKVRSRLGKPRSS